MEREREREINLGNWSQEAWKELSKDWSCEKTHFYKELFVSRELKKILEKENIKGVLSEKKVLRIADLGCGDGYMTALFLKILSELLGSSVKFEVVCIDISESFLECAKLNIEKLVSNRISSLELMEADLSKPVIFGETDVIFSSFTLHNIGNFRIFLENLKKNSTKGTVHIHAFLCPLFVEVLKHKGVVKVLDGNEHWDGEILLWRYRAWYPIVGERGITYFPYFHRYVGDYIQSLLNYGIMLTNFSYHLPKERNLLNYFPFCPAEHNVYFPEIWSYPSLNILVGESDGG